MKLKIGTKIIGGNLIILLLLAVVSVLGLVRLNAINTNVAQVVDQNYPGAKYALEINVDFMSALNRLRNLYISGDPQKVIQMRGDLAKAQQELTELAKYMTTAEGQKMVSDFQDELKTFEAEANETAELLLNNERDTARANMEGHLQDSSDQLRAQVAALVERKDQQVMENGKASKELVSSTTTIVLVVGVVALLIGLAVGITLSLAITRPLAKLVSGMDTVAKGDLTHTVRIKTGDELEDAARVFAQMSENLKALIAKVSDTAEQVAASSEELSSSAQQVGQVTGQVAEAVAQIAKGADESAKAAQSSSDVVENMAASIHQMSASAQNVASHASGTLKIAEEGSGAVEQAVHQMGVIAGTTHAAAEAVKGLGERSQQIGQIVETITGIADQTNLLALNAAIEAARAGEQGRGFAVVAEEVRKLAEQSRQAAEQISGLVRDIQNETDKAVTTMEAGSKEVVSGTKVVGSAGEAFDAIVKAVQAAVAQIQEVGAATQELAAGTDQVVKSVETIAAITEEAASGTEEVSASTEEQSASVEEIAASSESLAEMAQELQKAVSVFKL